MSVRGKAPCSSPRIPGKSGEYTGQSDAGCFDSLTAKFQIFSGCAQINAADNRTRLFETARLPYMFQCFQGQVGANNLPREKEIRQKPLGILLPGLFSLLAEYDDDFDSLVFSRRRITPAPNRIGVYLGRVEFPAERTRLVSEIFYPVVSEILKRVSDSSTIEKIYFSEEDTVFYWRRGIFFFFLSTTGKLLVFR